MIVLLLFEKLFSKIKAANFILIDLGRTIFSFLKEDIGDSIHHKHISRQLEFFQVLPLIFQNIRVSLFLLRLDVNLIYVLG
jgi:hypothetical protein